MDLNQITDVKELKALAYDQLVARQTAEQNLAALETRMQQLAKEEQEAQAKEDTKK